ncbi:UPF0251 protein [Shewanella sp. NFH-SH190041]|uniref:DUF134 domain-containing protein n=1 Tax=Shewanella sp. NFH-SH190041 TaxID=2950245 RepID=UPI0021C43E1C|nr:DUF134 domain-containing protein [Shewanella sp. NFH-SH190041]BDM65587.1 UPF0251 protein [Shewanella sp. NFH-SH190041]
MARPKKCRHLSTHVPCRMFKPNGIPGCTLDKIQLLSDEFEALHLADVLQLHQQEAAQQMGVSRQTFGNLIASARQKTATAITQGRALALPPQPAMQETIALPAAPEKLQDAEK